MGKKNHLQHLTFCEVKDMTIQLQIWVTFRALALGNANAISKGNLAF